MPTDLSDKGSELQLGITDSSLSINPGRFVTIVQTQNLLGLVPETNVARSFLKKPVVPPKSLELDAKLRHKALLSPTSVLPVKLMVCVSRSTRKGPPSFERTLYGADKAANLAWIPNSA